MAKNINEATVEDLAKLPQMSQTRAETIIHWRDQHGSFKSIDELSNIPGIGEKMATQVGEFFVVGDADAEPVDDDEEDDAPARSKAATDEDEGEEGTDEDEGDEGGEEVTGEEEDDQVEASSDDDDGKGAKEDKPAPRQARRTSSTSTRRRNSSGEGGTDKEGHRLNKDGSVDKRQFNKAPGEGGPGNTADEEMSDDEKKSARG